MLTPEGIKLLTCEKVSRLENGGIRFLLLKTKNKPVGCRFDCVYVVCGVFGESGESR